MSNRLKEKAVTALNTALPPSLAGTDKRLEMLPGDGTMVVYFQNRANGQAPEAMLRLNGKPCNQTVAGPMVFDPVTGGPAVRFAIPYPIWMHPHLLKAVFAGWRGKRTGDTRFAGDHSPGSGLARMKSVSPGVEEHRYGRSSRLAILFDRRPFLLTAMMFPGALFESCLMSSPDRLSGVARVLLARSGVPGRPFYFHMLRKHSFSHVERAVAISPNIGAGALKSLEIDLIRRVEEDRELTCAMLSSEVPWETFGLCSNTSDLTCHGRQKEHEGAKRF